MWPTSQSRGEFKMVAGKSLEKIKKDVIREIRFLNPEMNHIKIFEVKIQKKVSKHNKDYEIQAYIIQHGKKPKRIFENDKKELIFGTNNIIQIKQVFD